MYFSTCRSRWNRNSSLSSLSTEARRNKERKRIYRSLNMAYLLGRTEDLGDCRGQLLPRVLLDFELVVPALREFVVFCTPVVLRCAPPRLDQSAALKSVERRIQRTLDRKSTRLN